MHIVSKVLTIYLLMMCLSPGGLWAGPYDHRMAPGDHKAKLWLDKMFRDRGYPHSRKGFMKMGFNDMSRPGTQGAIVLKHRSCKGYLFKVYPTNVSSIDEALVFSNRIEGAEAIGTYIKVNGFESYFKVPNKWLYNYSMPKKKGNSHYILIVEDMKILNGSDNKNRWKSSKISSGFLKALYLTLKDVGLIDSIYIDNIPFCKDGKVAFIDTEHYHNGPVKFDNLTKHLSGKNQKVWRQIIHER